MPLPSNIPCPYHSNQQYYISSICLYTHCQHQPALCLACRKDFHSDHSQFCYTFQEIEEKTKNLDSVMDIKQSYMIFKKEIIDLLNFIGLTIQQSTFSFQSRFFTNEYKLINQSTINELGNALRNTSEQISKRHQIISYFNEFLAEFEKRTKQFTGQIKYQYPKQLDNLKYDERDTIKTRLVKRNSEIISISRSNNQSKVELSKISRAQSDFSIDNHSKFLIQQDFNKILFRLDFNHIQGEANIINDYLLSSQAGCIALLYPPLNDIMNNYIKLSFKIEKCQGLVCIGVATNTQKCSFANLDSRGKLYTSWNFLEHNKQSKIKFGQSDTIICYVNKHQKTVEFSKNDVLIQIFREILKLNQPKLIQMI
ncbi:unnamed protein product [Paramecium sonneborni]|uniref:Uncharacterized protein n=1 Tax=Paramecium sonneborni TaxID=65129 RepID=A0A8S1K327_9CILI|nr:unnamed protein product [Paramecium sonneborni]